MWKVKQGNYFVNDCLAYKCFVRKILIYHFWLSNIRSTCLLCLRFTTLDVLWCRLQYTVPVLLYNSWHNYLYWYVGPGVQYQFRCTTVLSVVRISFSLPSFISFVFFSLFHLLLPSAFLSFYFCIFSFVWCSFLHYFFSLSLPFFT